MRGVLALCLSLIILAACSAAPNAPAPSSHATLYVFRQQPPALVELSESRQSVREIPVPMPEGCRLDAINAPAHGVTVAIEYSCSFGQAVVWLNTDTGEAKQPVKDSDSHFLAWAPDGQAAYLKVDTINRPRVVLVPLVGEPRDVPIAGVTYSLAPKPGTRADFLFTFSRGMGFGSETWHTGSGGQKVNLVLADKHSYISFARWSPDATQVAFIKVPDSATPFTVGELWVMFANGSNARKLADADAGHGFAPAWSPDGRLIAFVVRDNPDDPKADTDAGALESSIAVVVVDGDATRPVTRFQHARVEAPAWSPDGKTIAFAAFADDKMSAYTVDLTSGQVTELLAAPACCPVWVTK